MGRSPERRLIVKHTFLEVVEKPSARSRAFTDSDVFVPSPLDTEVQLGGESAENDDYADGRQGSEVWQIREEDTHAAFDTGANLRIPRYSSGNCQAGLDSDGRTPATISLEAAVISSGVAQLGADVPVRNPQSQNAALTPALPKCNAGRSDRSRLPPANSLASLPPTGVSRQQPKGVMPTQLAMAEQVAALQEALDPAKQAQMRAASESALSAQLGPQGQHAFRTVPELLGRPEAFRTIANSNSQTKTHQEKSANPMPDGLSRARNAKGKAAQGVPLTLSAMLEADEPDETVLTTVMLRNVPNRYTRTMLVELLDEEGFAGRYGFVYLPIDFKTHSGLGYAFVDLNSPEDAQALRRHFENFARWRLSSDKVCTVNWSHPEQQGLSAHVERYRNSPVMHSSVCDEWKPAIFSEGVRVPFPEPTRRLRAPNVKQLPQGAA